MIATAPATHGMTKQREEPDWTPLTIEEVRALLRQYPDCGEPIVIEFTSPRPFSAASVVSTSHGRIFVKRHHRLVRDAASLNEEHRFMQYLHNANGPVARVLSTFDGETVIENGDWTYEAHEVPAGEDIYSDALSWTPYLSVAHARSAGQLLARLHLAAEGYDAPQRINRPLVSSYSIYAGDDPSQKMNAYLRERAALANDRTTHDCCAKALALLDPFYQQLKPYLGELAPLWTHNDLHGSNILWSGKEQCAKVAVDFGLADRTTAVHDIAIAMERSFVEWLELDGLSVEQSNIPVHVDQMLAFLDGYVELRPLTEAEASALAPMMALCHVEYALTEADYFTTVLPSETKKLLCVEGYLVGHARWFHSAAGQRMLKSIERWASAYTSSMHRQNLISFLRKAPMSNGDVR